MQTDNQASSPNTALLVMDVQNGIVSSLGDSKLLMDTLAATVAATRKHHIPVLYVRVAFRKGYPEVSLNNQSFSQIKTSARGLDTEKATAIHPSVAPASDDIIITKRRISAFTGSDLEVVLRSLGIDHLVLTGISTSGVVLSTVREAADKDYALTVLSDGCADRDEEVHRVLMKKIFPRQATVTSSELWQASL